MPAIPVPVADSRGRPAQPRRPPHPTPGPAAPAGARPARGGGPRPGPAAPVELGGRVRRAARTTGSPARSGSSFSRRLKKWAPAGTPFTGLLLAFWLRESWACGRGLSTLRPGQSAHLYTCSRRRCCGPRTGWRAFSAWCRPAAARRSARQSAAPALAEQIAAAGRICRPAACCAEPRAGRRPARSSASPHRVRWRPVAVPPRSEVVPLHPGSAWCWLTTGMEWLGEGDCRESRSTAFSRPGKPGGAALGSVVGGQVPAEAVRNRSRSTRSPWLPSHPQPHPVESRTWSGSASKSQ